MTARAAATSAPSGVAVRAATVADLDAVVALRIALLEEHGDNPVYGKLRPDATERARRLFAVQLSSDHEITFLAVRGSLAIGILRCVHSSGSPLLFPAYYAYVSSVYVTPAERRRGVLRQLLAAATDWCSSRGLSEMRLHSTHDGVEGNAAWDALGFEPVELLRVKPLR